MSAPFFQNGPVSDGRRLLLISYHFPPGGATGALRWQKLAAHAAQRGWGLDVLTLDPAQLTKSEMARLDELPPGTRLYAVPDAPPSMSRLFAIVDRLRAPAHAAPQNAAPVPAATPKRSLTRAEVAPFAFRPKQVMQAVRAWRYLNRESGWARNATRIGTTIADASVHDAIVSCGPPHAAHLAALTLSRRTGIPLVLDMRDPWGRASMVQSYCASPLFFHLLHRRESAAIERAALVFVNTDTHRIALQSVHPRAAGRIHCVLNGCDVEDVPPLAAERAFRIAYAGNVYLDRDPAVVFQAAAKVVRAHGLTPREFGIDLIGDVATFNGRPMADIARQAGLDGFVTLHARRPRAEVFELLARAAMLLSLPQSADLSVPSKIFEYMQFEAWLLVLASAGSATELVVRGTGADVAEGGDVDRIAALIDKRVGEFFAGARPGRLIERNPHLQRAQQANLLFDALDAAIPRRRVTANSSVRRGAELVSATPAGHAAP